MKNINTFIKPYNMVKIIYLFIFVLFNYSNDPQVLYVTNINYRQLIQLNCFHGPITCIILYIFNNILSLFNYTNHVRNMY